MKWKGYWNREGLRHKYNFGLRDWLLVIVTWVFVAALAIGLFYLGRVRFIY